MMRANHNILLSRMNFYCCTHTRQFMEKQTYFFVQLSTVRKDFLDRSIK